MKPIEQLERVKGEENKRDIGFALVDNHGFTAVDRNALKLMYSRELILTADDGQAVSGLLRGTEE